MRVFCFQGDVERKQELISVKPKRYTYKLQETNLSNKGFRNPSELREKSSIFLLNEKSVS